MKKISAPDRLRAIWPLPSRLKLEQPLNQTRLAGKFLLGCILALSCCLIIGSEAISAPSWWSVLRERIGSGRAALTEDAVLSKADVVPDRVNGDDTYISPNEFDNHVQFSQLAVVQPQSGTVEFKTASIAVGTFRVFHLGASVRRDFLISLDFSPGITKFNDSLAGMIAKTDRIAFIELLLPQVAGQLPILDALTAPASSSLSEREVIRTVSSSLLGDTDACEIGRLKLLALARDNNLPESTKAVLKTLGDERNWKNFIKAFAESTKTEKRWRASFWGSDEGYRHLQDTIAQGRFVAVTGSLSGEKAISSLAASLRRKKILVSELDISNAAEAVVGSARGEGLRALAANTNLLPMNDDSRVLLTMNAHGMNEPTEQVPVGRWFYRVYTRHAFVSALSGVEKRNGATGLNARLLRAPEAPPLNASSHPLCLEAFSGLSPGR